MSEEGSPSKAVLSKRTTYTLFALAYAIGGIGFLVEMTGGAWDIHWHIAQLVEVFWTPPHTLLYGGLAIVAAMAIGGRMLRYLGRAPPAGLRLGLQMALAGVAMQFAAGGFDSWWHATYGVDDAFSPPHILLIAGMNVAGVGLVVGLSTLLRQKDFWTTADALARPALAVALPLALVGLYFSLWGMAWVLSYPGFDDPTFLANPWARGAVAFTFAALLPFVILSAARLARWWGAATAVLLVSTVDSYLVAGLMGEDIDLGDTVFFLLGIAIFLTPGVVADVVLRWRLEGWALISVATVVGAIGGFVTVFIGGPPADMTGALDANPQGFVLLYPLGGVLGGLLSLPFVDRFALRVQVPRPRPAAG